MKERDRFLGTWQLLPELSLYAAGSPPVSGTYAIMESARGQLQFSVSWQSEPGGPLHAIEFGGPSDGTVTELPLPADVTQPAIGLPDALTITRVDEATLDSAALSAGRIVAYARRVASVDGALLAVLQETVRGGGERTRNFQVYRRARASDVERLSSKATPVR